MMGVLDLFDLKGKVALVTGASSGLGVVFAEALAEAGADVAIVARRKERLDEVAKSISKSGRRILPIQCDVSVQAQVKSAVESALKDLGRLDVMVNNAGVAAMGPSTEMKVEDWEKVLSVNLTGVFLGSREAAKTMIAQGSGKIINIASIYGASADIFPAAPYYATKAAVINLTRELAVEWAPFKINVNAIGPGFFPSEMTEGLFRDSRYVEYILKQTPMGRLGNLADLKGAVVFLASSASDFVTGQTLFVDGGWTIW